MKQVAPLIIPFLLMAAEPCFGSEPEAPSSLEQTELSFHHMESLYQVLAAEMALDREQLEVALANYIAAAKETQDPRIAERATQIALSISDLSTALLPARIWAKADKKNLEAQITTAAIYIRLNQAPQATPYMRLAETLNPEEAFEYFLVLFQQLQKEDDASRVIEALQLLTKEEPQNPAAHLALTEIYLSLGEDKHALEMSKMALAMKPEDTLTIQLYSETLLRSQGKTTAKAFLDKKAEEYPQNSLLIQYYTQFLLEQGFTTAAHIQVEKFANNEKATPEQLLYFARLSLQAQWFDIAEKILHRTSQVSESQDLSYYFLARSSEMQNHDIEAIKWFKKVSNGPFYVLSRVRASLLLSDKKQFAEALTLLYQVEPKDMAEKKQVLITTIEVLNNAQQYSKAFDILNENIEKIPNDLDLHYARSVIAEQLNQVDIAEADLKVILANQPNNLDALNALGYLLATKTNRFNEAQTALTHALTLSPNNAAILDSLGWLYYKMGDYSKSVEHLKKADHIMPDAKISAHLGEVLWKMHDFEGAKRVWRDALKQNPQHENILNAMQRMMVK